MSLVTDFCSSASKHASAMLGVYSLQIGGHSAVDAVLAETSSGREFSGIGMDDQVTLSAVVRSEDWTAAHPLVGSAYVGRRATARGETFRIAGVRVGAAFVTVTLESVNEVQ